MRDSRLARDMCIVAREPAAVAAVAAVALTTAPLAAHVCAVALTVGVASANMCAAAVALGCVCSCSKCEELKAE